MQFYVEGIWWYVILVDALLYTFLAWSKGRLHTQTTHWLSPYFPLEKSVSIIYLVLVLWVGFALYRLQLIIFW